MRSASISQLRSALKLVVVLLGMKDSSTQLTTRTTCTTPPTHALSSTSGSVHPMTQLDCPSQRLPTILLVGLEDGKTLLTLFRD